ncbi:MAG: S-methyl-5-thioribose-1-phosphate isomerase [Candidatus Omnitrophica bacterium]|nr:S-methyl-5-thioribose-1-phosphate isomerase [Candidatus Omnitrophota bacterium]
MKDLKFSPLFWPVKLKGKTILILDETLLPAKVKYIKATTINQVCRAIKEMKTRAVGQVILVLYAFIMVMRKNKKTTLSSLKKVAKEINATRPTLSFKFLTDMVIGWAEKEAPLEKSIFGFLEVLRKARIKQAYSAEMLFSDRDCILTHCNVSGLLPLVADLARNNKKKLSFFVTETRPYLQGVRLTAWELKRAGFEVTVIADNMVAQVMKEGKVNKVIVGADNLAQNGDIANKIGTYQIALLAKYFSIPFYVFCPPASKAKTGQEIKIEVRSEKELLEFEGKKLCSKGVKGYYPAFDVTPASLITKHIHMEV